MTTILLLLTFASLITIVLWSNFYSDPSRSRPLSPRPYACQQTDEAQT